MKREKFWVVKIKGIDKEYRHLSTEQLEILEEILQDLCVNYTVSSVIYRYHNGKMEEI